VYRSVAAREILASELKKLKLSNLIELTSAGLVARNGQYIPEDLNRELSHLGYPIPQRGAEELEAEMIVEADLILTADEKQRSSIVRVMPQASGKILTIKQMGRVARALGAGINGVPNNNVNAA
jgi:protein-tyrosine-phosphatase